MNNILNITKKSFHRLRSKLTIWNNRRKLIVRIETRNKILRLILHEKHEQKIKWILRILTLIGIISALVVIPPPFNFLLSLGLIILQQILEKIIFTFITLCVLPIPEWDPEEWLGMIFGVPQTEYLYKLGMLFKNEDYAQKTFECIKSWNYGLDDDVDNNIRISFIVDNNGTYSTYIYPSFEIDSINTARDEADKEMFKKRQLKEQQQLIFSIIISKRFDYTPSSFFRKFQLNYKNGIPIEFKPYIMSSQGIRELNILPIIKYNIKIKNGIELTEKDLEYHHRSLVVPLL